MNHPDQTNSPNSKAERSRNSLDELIDRSNQTIEQSRAQIARSRALRRSEADLARAIDQTSEEENGTSHAQEGGM
jgi:hypothetical protein